MDFLFIPLVVGLVGTGLWFATSAAAQAAPAIYFYLLVPYLLLGLLTLGRMYRDGTLLDLFRWRGGDITFGAALALGIGAVLYLGKSVLIAPGSAGELWLLRIYMQLGSISSSSTTIAWTSAAILAIALLDELTWRGLVQQILEERIGVRRGWIVCAILYGIAHVPAAIQLDMPTAGRNPLPVLASVFVALVLGFLVGRIQRLPPALIAHAMLSYAITMQFRLWRS